MSILRSKAVQKTSIRKMSFAWHDTKWGPLDLALKNKDHD